MRNLICVLSVLATIAALAVLNQAKQDKGTICRPVGDDGCCPACGESLTKAREYAAGNAYCPKCGIRLSWRKAQHG